MRIEQLEYVAAVTAHGSLRRASEALHISQPALSEAVTKLERELGLTLLDRRRSGSRISREGLDLLQHMTEVLESVDRLRQAAGDQAVRTRVLRIGTVNTASSTLLAPALRDPDTDTLLVIFSPVGLSQTAAVGAVIGEAVREARAEGVTKPVLCCFTGAHDPLSAGDERLPSYRFPESAARALADSDGSMTTQLPGSAATRVSRTRSRWACAASRRCWTPVSSRTSAS